MWGAPPVRPCCLTLPPLVNALSPFFPESLAYLSACSRVLGALQRRLKTAHPSVCACAGCLRVFPSPRPPAFPCFPFCNCVPAPSTTSAAFLLMRGVLSPFGFSTWREVISCPSFRRLRSCGCSGRAAAAAAAAFCCAHQCSSLGVDIGWA